jgi:hypothetical protein
MTTTHLIKNGRIINTIVASVQEAQTDFPDCVCIDGSVGSIGWTYASGVLTPPPEPEKTHEQIYRELESAVDNHVESVGMARGYRSRTHAMDYTSFENPWKAECIKYGEWFASCYVLCQQIHSNVIAGTRPIPTKTELISELPAMVWPE